jgi:diaminopimelate epimerase
MQALGNDFVVIDGIKQDIDVNTTMIPQIADRHFGIGFDQLLLIQKSQHADFACRFFNADGSEAEQCGNGIRCVARFINEEGLSEETSLKIETKAGIVALKIHDFENIEAMMGIPIFDPKKIPFSAEKIQKSYDISIDHPLSPLSIAVLSLGNPHAILSVDSIDDNLPIAELSKKIAAYFPQGANVGFMQVINPKRIRLRTFERGVGETLSCGSNACAAVVAGILNNGLDNIVTVELSHGNLSIEWQGENKPVLMSGPAMRVFSGIY